jgi:glycosyltransferase involved in cell wall biosynthesis
MEPLKLSYLITTFNKLSYLKITLPFIIENCKGDEEIIVIDGGSKDGTAEYLKELKAQGKIHQLLSEPDKGEAHGFNKGMMMARGELIKIMSDDDVYDFQVIDTCKKFMLSHPEVDVLGTEGLSTNLVIGQGEFAHSSNAMIFKKWLNKESSCWFCGLSLLIRKSSLPLLGLFYTGITMIDFDYIARLSVIRPHIAFYTGYSYVNVVSEGSNSVKRFNILRSEQEKVEAFYFGKKPAFSLKNKLRQMVSKVIRRKETKLSNAISFPDGFKAGYDHLKKANSGTFTFLHGK